MDGYDRTTYGERFADVYDDWYHDITDTETCVATVSAMADASSGPRPARILELGVGTGRLAVPLALAGHDVTGVDSSPAMLAVLEGNAAEAKATVTAIEGDMAEPLVEGPFDVVLAAFNTLFNLPDATSQQACLASATRLLAPGGAVVVEAFVPDTALGRTEAVRTRSMNVDSVVLEVSRHDPDTQTTYGQFVDISASGVKLRPWSVRWSTPEQLDDMAAACGLEVRERWADWKGTPWNDDPVHVTIYVSKA